MSNIGNNIRKIRDAKGLTQQELGDRCEPKMKDSAIRRYESGTIKPKRDSMERIARALGVSVFDLDPDYLSQEDLNKAIKFALDNKPTSQELELMKKNYKGLTAEQTSKRLQNLIKHKSKLLNNEGNQRVVDYMDDLIGNPKYQVSISKGTDNIEDE